MSYIKKKCNAEDKFKTLTDLAKYESLGYNLNTRISPERFFYSATAGNTETNIFKVLQSNFCEGNCLYCASRKGRNTERYSFTPGKLAKLFFKLYKQGKVKGLFLSSGVYKGPDYSQERTLRTVKILRNKYSYKGYIHYKILPGADLEFIKGAAPIVDRLSLNLEAVSKEHLENISPCKKFYPQLIKRLKALASYNNEKPLNSGITTQLVVGASDESDREILTLSDKLYNKLKLRRVYYSGFSPVSDTPLECENPCGKVREYRLYQADYLIRKYNFKPNEIVYKKGYLQKDIDPKLAWAKAHPEEFPVEINNAPYEKLIRVPGIGKKSASKIVKVRNVNKIRKPSQLEKLNINISKIKEFLLFDGKKFSSNKKYREKYE